MRRKLWQLGLPFLTLAAAGAGLLRIPELASSTPQYQTAGLERSDQVIRNKIARKQAKLDHPGDRPENPDGYADYRAASRVLPEGRTLIEMQLEGRRHTEMMPRVTADKDAGLWEWSWLGPGNIGGRVRAILTHPTEPDVLWAGSAGGGVWKTTNGGNSWYPLQNFLPSMAISAMAMDPNNPDIIYAATGEGLVGGASPSAGIFKSYDGGGTWSQLANSFDPVEAFQINDLISHPTNSSILYAAVARRNRNIGLGHVWRSLNAGQDWESVLDTPSTAMDLGIDPDHPNVVIMSYYNGVYRSELGGNQGTWVELSTGLAGKLRDDTGRTAFAFGAGNDMIYASCDVPRADGGDQGEIWRSTDNGVTWEHRGSPHHLKDQGNYDNVIWLEPGGTERIIFGGINIWWSPNGGTGNLVMSDWTAYHTGNSAHADQHAIVPHINYGNGSSTIFFGNDGGVQKNIYGITLQPNMGWVNLAHNLGITQFYGADCTPDGSIILGGTQDNDDLKFSRSAGAQRWYQAETGDGTYCFIDPDDPSIMYGSYPRLMIEKSTNGGLSYINYYSGLGDAGVDSLCQFVAPFALDKVAPSNLIAGGKSIWRSYNGGLGWHRVLDVRNGRPKCSAVEISPTAGSMVVWVGYEDGAIWKTENTTVTWAEVEPGVGGVLPHNWVRDIEISPHDPNVVLVGFAGYFANRVWMSFDNGATFTNCSGTGTTALPAVQVNTVSFHPTNQDWIYAGTDIGLYASEDRGQTWSVTPAHAVNEGPVYTEISDLIWHSGQTLVAVTHGRGMYECRPLESVFVAAENTGNEDGTIWSPFNTVREGYNFIGNGSNLIIFGGQYDEGAQVMNKRITVQGLEGPVIVK